MLAYLFLGILQGVFEWLPVSSEGIVALASQFLEIRVNPVDLALFLHLGTLGAVLVYFKKDWQKMISLKDKKLLRFLVISSLISLIISYPIYQLVRNTILGASLLLIMGFALLGTAFLNKKKKKLNLISFEKLALVAGFFQGLAVIPGFSRSASTIFVLSLGELKPVEILKTSYMMSVPIVLASSTYLFLKNPVLILESWPALMTSFLTGFLSLNFLINLAKKLDFFKFALFFSLACFLGVVVKLMVG